MGRKTDRKLSLRLPHFKIISVVVELNERSLYPLPEGVCKILHGTEDGDTSGLESLSAYGSLGSTSFRKTARMVSYLLSVDCLQRIYDSVTETLYLKSTPLGEELLARRFDGKTPSFHKRPSAPKKTIVKIS